MNRTQRKCIPAVTPAQIKLIHALKRALQLGEDPALWQQIIYTRFGVISSKKLDIAQAGEFIDEMQTKAIDHGLWEKKEDKRQRFETLADRPGMASPGQLRKIEAIWQETSRVPAGPERDTALRHFIARIAKVSHIRFLDMKGATAVINALASMQKTKKDRGGKP